LSRLTHHPPEILLLGYAAGSLREPQALAVATHLAYCPECRREMRQLDELGGALIDELPPEPLPPDALSQMLARLDEIPAPCTARSTKLKGGPQKVPQKADMLGSVAVPEPLRGYLAEIGMPVTWVDLADGIVSLRLPIAKAPVVAEILRMDPDSILAAHRHSDQELILVLQGEFVEEGRELGEEVGRYATGDLGEFEAGSVHTVVAGRQGCVCYRVLAGPVERLSMAEKPHNPIG